MTEFIKAITSFDVGGFGVFIVCLALIFAGSRFLQSSNKDSAFARYSLQIFGLTFLVPIILMVAVALKLEGQAVTGLLGTIVGYIFGTSASSRAQDQTSGQDR
jgi:hypothetical protein